MTILKLTHMRDTAQRGQIFFYSLIFCWVLLCAPLQSNAKDIFSSQTIPADATSSETRQLIQMLMNTAQPGDRVVLDGAGRTYTIDGRLFVRSDVNIHLKRNVTLQADITAQNFLAPVDNHSLFRITPAVKNVIISGEGPLSVMNGIGRLAQGEDTMESPGLGPDYREDRHGVESFGGQDITIRDLTISNMGGDAVLIAGGSGANGKIPSRNIRIKGLNAVGNRRQGISVTNVDGLFISDSIMRNTGIPDGTGGNPFTRPAAGIDIEPDVPEDVIKDVRIRRVRFYNNLGNGLFFALDKLNESSERVYVEAKDLWIEKSGRSGISINNFRNGFAESRVDGLIRITDTVITDTIGANTGGGGNADIGAGAIVIVNGAARSSNDPQSTDPNDLRYVFARVTIEGTGTGDIARAPVFFRSFGAVDRVSSSRPLANGNVNFRNVVIEDHEDRPIILADLADPRGFMARMKAQIVARNPTGISVDLDNNPEPSVNLIVRDTDTLPQDNILSDIWLDDGNPISTNLSTITLEPGMELEQDILTRIKEGSSYYLEAEIDSPNGANGIISVVGQLSNPDTPYRTRILVRDDINKRLGRAFYIPNRRGFRQTTSLRVVLLNRGTTPITLRNLNLVPVAGQPL